MTLELTKPADTNDWGEPRSRTVTWHDPGPGTAKGLSRWRASTTCRR